MFDKRQVMYDMERCICHVPDACRDCSHYTGTAGYGCMENLMSNALYLLKEQESLKQKMWNALYAEEDKLEKHYVGTDEIDKWIVDYRPFLQRGFEIAIEVIAAHEEGGEVK